MTNIEISYAQQNTNILIHDSHTGKYEEIHVDLSKKNMRQKDIFITYGHNIAAHVVVQIATA